MGFDLAQEDVEQVFVSFDGNHDGRIDYRDFCDAIIYEVDPLVRQRRGGETDFSFKPVMHRKFVCV